MPAEAQRLECCIFMMIILMSHSQSASTHCFNDQTREICFNGARCCSLLFWLLHQVSLGRIYHQLQIHVHLGLCLLRASCRSPCPQYSLWLLHISITAFWVISDTDPFLQGKNCSLFSSWCSAALLSPAFSSLDTALNIHREQHCYLTISRNSF